MLARSDLDVHFGEVGGQRGVGREEQAQALQTRGHLALCCVRARMVRLMEREQVHEGGEVRSFPAIPNPIANPSRRSIRWRTARKRSRPSPTACAERPERGSVRACMCGQARRDTDVAALVPAISRPKTVEFGPDILQRGLAPCGRHALCQCPRLDTLRAVSDISTQSGHNR